MSSRPSVMAIAACPPEVQVAKALTSPTVLSTTSGIPATRCCCGAGRVATSSFNKDCDCPRRKPSSTALIGSFTTGATATPGAGRGADWPGGRAAGAGVAGVGCGYCAAGVAGELPLEQARAGRTTIAKAQPLASPEERP